MQPNNTEHPEIPEGHYCYKIVSIEYGPKTEESAQLAELLGIEDPGSEISRVTEVCPHWGCDPEHPPHENGFCRLLNINDWTTPGGLLWDQVKECGINLEQLSDKQQNE